MVPVCQGCGFLGPPPSVVHADRRLTQQLCSCLAAKPASGSKEGAVKKKKATPKKAEAALEDAATPNREGPGRNLAAEMASPAAEASGAAAPVAEANGTTPPAKTTAPKPIRTLEVREREIESFLMSSSVFSLSLQLVGRRMWSGRLVVLEGFGYVLAR